MNNSRGSLTSIGGVVVLECSFIVVRLSCMDLRYSSLMPTWVGKLSSRSDSLGHFVSLLLFESGLVISSARRPRLNLL